MRVLVVFALLVVPAAVARADIVKSSEAWTVAPQFEKNEDARKALSGAACVTGSNHCFAVNDEKKYAQFFDIDGFNITPKELIRLIPDEIDNMEMDEVDAEGVAYVASAGQDGPSHFYVIGSHGLSRQGALQPSRFFLLRFPVDPSTGRPTFAFGDSDPGPEIARTAKMRGALKALADVGTFAEQKLDGNGLTIEGLAIVGEEALFGLRSPCIAANAYVVRVPLDGLFQETVPAATASKLELGDNAGVRDLAPVKGGLLVLAGRSDDDRGAGQMTCEKPGAPPVPPPSVWFWSGQDGDPAKPLGMLPDTTGAAETLIVLEESDTAYRALVLFDGVENGGPVEFIIDK